ncbi:MAG: hypothetical protein J6T62_01140 [Fibrobacter sp.]|jgi:hypothetical protein|nr:hypothetical protein [Fibrobacter sp.]
MVKCKHIIALALALGTAAMASESGELSYRAQKSLENGKFARSYSQLERALLASRKEADLLSEARILLSMAHIRTLSLDLALADSLVSIVRKGALDNQTSVLYNQVKIALSNAHEKYADAVKLCSEQNVDSLKKTSDGVQATFYSECAIAQGAVHKMEEAQESLKMLGKRVKKSSGIYAWTEARIADLNAQANADSLYQVAESRTIQGNRPHMTATILYYRGLLAEKKNAELAKDYFLRSKNAFELMGLPNNAKRSTK